MLLQLSGRSPPEGGGFIFLVWSFDQGDRWGQVQDTHQGQCLHSPQLYREPDDCVSSSAAGEPVLQTAPQNPAAEQSQRKRWKLDCVLLSGTLLKSSLCLCSQELLPTSISSSRQYLLISLFPVLIILQLNLKLALSDSFNQTVYLKHFRNHSVLKQDSTQDKNRKSKTLLQKTGKRIINNKDNKMQHHSSSVQV